MINNELLVPSPLDIEITGQYNMLTRQCDVSVCVTATDQISYSNLKLRIALVESNIAWQAPNGSYWHHQTFRHMYPNTNGVSFSIAEGQTYNYNQTFTLDSPLVDVNCDIVVFVQSDAGHRILQGAKEGVTSLFPLNTLFPFSLALPTDGEEINTCYPTFTWQSTDEPCAGTDVSYVVYVAQEPTFSSPLMSEPVLDTTWTSEICLIPEIPYYWKVLASNGSALDRFSEEVFTFSIAQAQVPTLSEWGMIIMGLLLLSAGTVALLPRKSRIPGDPAPEET